MDRGQGRITTATEVAGATELAPRLRQELIGRTEDRLKGAYVIALAMLKDPHDLLPISQVAQSKIDDELLSYCMWAFAVLQNRDAIPIIEKVLGQSSVEATQEAAATALGVLGAVQ